LDKSKFSYDESSPAFQAMFGGKRREIERYPEKMLMLAILEDAVACFMKNFGSKAPRKVSLHRTADDWITSDKADYLFSFVVICEQLNLSPEYIRRGLTEYKLEEVSEDENTAEVRRKRKYRKRGT
jgi:hypothetical protein